MKKKPFVLGVLFYAAVAVAPAYSFTVNYQAVPAVITTTNSVSGTLHGHGAANVTGTSSSPYLHVSPWSGINSSKPYNYVAQGYYSYTFAAVLKSVSFIWGTPDFYNMIEIANSGSSLSFLAPGNPGAPPANGQSYLVTISADNASEYFNSLTMFSTGPSFEFANVVGVPAPTPVPLPPGLLLFGSALLGLFTLAKRRVLMNG